MIGTTIGNFRFVEKIGEGGMGVVYKGVDTGLDRQVAIKVLRPELTFDQQLVERFRDEAKAQANLNHSNIATLYAFVHTEGHCLIVMEFIEGNTFEMLLSSGGRLPWRGAVSLTKQALEGLGFAHARGVVHRDIKPANLMLANSGIVKIMDFGIVKALGGVMKTSTGTQMGTPRYMSPEQIRALRVDARSDLYSMGVTLYELLTGNAPFQGDSDYDLMTKHIHTPPPSFTDFHRDIPGSVEQAVMKALAKDSADRFQTAEQFSAALVAATEAATQKQEADKRAPLEASNAKGKDSRRKTEEPIAVNLAADAPPRKTHPVSDDARGVAVVEIDGGEKVRERWFAGLVRAFRVLIFPGKVFSELREHPTWLTPLLLVGLADAAWVWEIKWLLPNYPLGSPFLITLRHEWMFALPVMNLLFDLLLAAILFAVLRKKGQDLTFRKTFAVTMYAQIPLILETVLSSITNGKILPMMKTTIAPLADFIVRYLPAVNLPGGSREYLLWSLLGPNIFTVWTALLLALGLSRVSQVKRSTATWAVFGFYIFDAAINAVLVWERWV